MSSPVPGAHAAHPSASPSRSELVALSLAALGVVYGDIGTSPLYSLKECLAYPFIKHAVRPEPDAVLGVLSLVLWSLLLVVVVKYLTFVLQADNKGEGGILALAALLPPKAAKAGLGVATLAALLGGGLLYGDGIITPAISVLGAIEGLAVATDALEPAVMPISIAILIGLFVVQRHGTHAIGKIFGWIMLVWFVVLGVEGVLWVVKEPSVMRALSPVYGVRFLLDHGTHGFLLLGSVVLVVTGGEALYADMGHFGRKPIRVAWYTVVLPGLVLNYFGQGALFLIKPIGTVENPFFELVSGPWIYPQVVIATLAAIIASQALISGAFSLTRQAVQLGYLPRVSVVHTSAKQEGQIYIPEVNVLLAVGTLALVVGFGSSTRLAGAYGIAVTITMTITTWLFYQVARHRWGWKRRRLVPLVLILLPFDLAFLGANAAKIPHGGWVPLGVGFLVVLIMTTWWRGRYEMSQSMNAGSIPDDLFFADLTETRTHRVRGTAVFMTSSSEGIPNVLMHHLKHNQVLHKQVVLLSLITEPVPFVPGNNAIEVHELAHGFYRVIARVGFMQSSDVPRILARCAPQGILAEEMTTTYYLGRQTLLTTGRIKMARWRKRLFSFLMKNARPPTDFFNLPPNRVVELGVQIEM
ncbi:MAG TPA: KUP/HAK/KT family potassium transporter [Kofleriaceae bacterium]|nr:KUP/HAK/KT family potassium transporter [Kofleriaceae bacterium]